MYNWPVKRGFIGQRKHLSTEYSTAETTHITVSNKLWIQQLYVVSSSARFKGRCFLNNKSIVIRTEGNGFVRNQWSYDLGVIQAPMFYHITMWIWPLSNKHGSSVQNTSSYLLKVQPDLERTRLFSSARMNPILQFLSINVSYVHR